MDVLMVFMIVGIAGIGAQWLAWRMQIPAIVLMLVAGVIVGPVAGLVKPTVVFGDIFQPMIAIAVAIILFEGGLTLNFARLRDAEHAVRRLVFVGGPLIWALASVTAHYVAGLSWITSLVFGGILIVTGPTVVIPLLRQANLKHRPAEILRWEAIVNDPVGALAAVFAFEVFLIFNTGHSLSDVVGLIFGGILVSVFLGWAGAKMIIQSFRRGAVPEYLKVPVLVVTTIVVYGIPNYALEESGLLSVTLMGILIGNANLPSLGELRRFKEHVTILLVSGVFILLAASLEFATIAQLSWQHYLFVLLLIFVLRPIAIFTSLIGTNLSLNEKIMIGWIAPRGVVAVAVSGLFGAKLAELGVVDGSLMAALAFAVVTATVILHGFSIAPLAAALGLNASDSRGLLLIGANDFVLELAKVIRENGRPVLVAERNYSRLRRFRQEGIPNFFGEVLSEHAEHSIDHNVYSDLLALTDNDDYNALVCADFSPEFGSNHVFQFAAHKSIAGARRLPDTLGGRHLQGEIGEDDVNTLMREGARISATRMTDEFNYDAYREANPNAIVLMALPEKGAVRVFNHKAKITVIPGDKVVAITAARSIKNEAS